MTCIIVLHIVEMMVLRVAALLTAVAADACVIAATSAMVASVTATYSRFSTNIK